MADAPGKKRWMRNTVTSWSDSHLNYDTCRCMNLLSRAIINFFLKSWSPMRKMHNENGKAFISACVCACARGTVPIACTFLVISNRSVRVTLKATTTPCRISRAVQHAHTIKSTKCIFCVRVRSLTEHGVRGRAIADTKIGRQLRQSERHVVKILRPQKPLVLFRG